MLGWESLKEIVDGIAEIKLERRRGPVILTIMLLKLGHENILRHTRATEGAKLNTRYIPLEQVLKDMGSEEVTHDNPLFLTIR